jgi:hypothetical protein
LLSTQGNSQVCVVTLEIKSFISTFSVGYQLTFCLGSTLISVSSQIFSEVSQTDCGTPLENGVNELTANKPSIPLRTLLTSASFPDACGSRCRPSVRLPRNPVLHGRLHAAAPRGHNPTRGRDHHRAGARPEADGRLPEACLPHASQPTDRGRKANPPHVGQYPRKTGELLGTGPGPRQIEWRVRWELDSSHVLWHCRQGEFVSWCGNSRRGDPGAPNFL